jgi:hypothetical protein
VGRNNIFAFNPQYQWTRNRSEPHLSFTMERNIVYFDQGMLLRNNGSGQFRFSIAAGLARGFAWVQNRFRADSI